MSERWAKELALAGELSLFNQVQDVDPAQYADVARRMLQGHWLALREMRGAFVNKPPLMMWAQAAVMALVDVGSFSARLPALLYGLLAVFGTFLVGRELRDRKHGLIAAVLFASSVAFHHMVLDPKVDMPLTAMSTLAVWALLAARTRPRFYWLAWLFGALGMPSKGPIGLVLPTLAVAPELLREGGLSSEPTLWRRILSVRPLRGALLVAALVAPFYLATAQEAGGDSARVLLWNQGFGRLLGGGSSSDSTTPLYFVHTGLWAFLPYSPLLLAALGRRLRSMLTSRALPPEAARVPLWWFVLPFFVISFSNAKLPQYAYWLAPPAALLVAEELRQLSGRGHRRWQVALVSLGACAVVLGAVGVVVSFPSHWPWLLVVAAAPVAAWVATTADEPVFRTTAVCACATLGALGYLHGGLQPALLEYQPSRAIAAIVRAEDPSAAVLSYIDVPPAFSLSFYAERDLVPVDVSQLKAAVEAGQVHLVLVGDEGADAVRAVGLKAASLGRFPVFSTSIPSGAFLMAKTRESVLGHVELLSVAPR